MTAFDELVAGMAAGRTWSFMGDSDAVRSLLDRVYDERCHSARHHRDVYQLRVNLQKKDDAASYAGWIIAGNPTSGRLSIDVLREVGRGCPCLPEALDAECDHLEGPDVAILPTEGLAAWLAPAVLRGGPPERALLGPLLKPAQDGPPQVVVHGSALTHA